MSAEKEIVNYWLNRQGFFTISNIKVANKDIGILALKFDKNVIKDIFHIEVNCSISSSISETTDLKKTIAKLVETKFFDPQITKSVEERLKQFTTEKQKIKKVLILGAMPKSRKKEIIEKFESKGVRIIEFEEIIYDTIQNLDSQYYKEDIIRTLQLVRYLLLSNPRKLAALLSDESNVLNANTRGEFINELLSYELMKKQFMKTDEKDIIEILKNSAIRPEKLAEFLERDILNRRTRKTFMTSLLEQERIKKIYIKQTKKKPERPLSYFLE